MRTVWTENEIEILKEMFPHNYTVDVCKKLDRTISSVNGKAHFLKLRKTKSFMKMELGKQADRLRIIGAESRFKKGSTPPNKGKKMSAEMYEKSKHTFFRKGHEPKNTKYNGHERITKDGYVVIRIRKGKYVFKHRLIWEEHHGKIPKGMVLTFKDKNQLNMELENLELISMQENMLRNTIQRFPEELKSTIRLVHKLKRKIHEKQN